MSDITDINATEAVRIVGSETTGAEMTPVKSFPNQDLAVGDSLHTGGDNGEITVGTNPIVAKKGATNLAKRKIVRIYNSGTTTLYWGFNPATAASGVNKGEPIMKKCWVQVAARDNVNVYVVSDAAGGKATITEAG